MSLGQKGSIRQASRQRKEGDESESHRGAASGRCAQSQELLMAETEPPAVIAHIQLLSPWNRRTP